MEPDERGGDVWPERAVALYCAHARVRAAHRWPGSDRRSAGSRQRRTDGNGYATADFGIDSNGGTDHSAYGGTYIHRNADANADDNTDTDSDSGSYADGLTNGNADARQSLPLLPP